MNSTFRIHGEIQDLHEEPKTTSKGNEITRASIKLQNQPWYSGIKDEKWEKYKQGDQAELTLKENGQHTNIVKLQNIDKAIEEANTITKKELEEMENEVIEG